MNDAKKGFDIVHSCSAWDGYTFDPYTYIHAVNTLRKENNMHVIRYLRDYCIRDTGNSEWLENSTKVFFLLRILFVPKDQDVQFPTIHIGKPLDVEPSSTQVFPLYPLVLVQDVPLLTIPGFFLGGLPEDPQIHIDFCEAYCSLRPTPLRPPDNPLTLAESLMESKQWYRKAEEFDDDQAILQAQLLRLVRTVYTVPGIDESAFFSHLKPPGIWQGCISSLQHINAIWDENQDIYVFKETHNP